MKLGTIEHPKMVKLMGLLKVPQNHAVGILEHLWHWAGRYSPQGDIGKYTDEQIGQLVAPEVRCLVKCLVEAGWVDEAPAPFRLVIHGWREHADQRVRKWLERNELRWAEEIAQEIKNGGACPDNVRTVSGQNPVQNGVKTGVKNGRCPDGVQPRARATEPEPEPEAEPEPSGEASAAGFPKSCKTWVAEFRAVPGLDDMRPYKKINEVEAERWWMEFGPLRKVAGVEAAVAAAWVEFKRKSNEVPYPRPVSAWIGFVNSALRMVQREDAQAAGGGSGGQYVPRGAVRDGSGMPLDVDLDDEEQAGKRG